MVAVAAIDRRHVAVFDGMQSAQCAVLAVAAYRNARRSGHTLIETMRRVVRELFEHQQGPLIDDASLLLLEWKGGNEQDMLA